MGTFFRLLHGGLFFVTGRLDFLFLLASVHTHCKRITRTARAAFVCIPCKETQKMTVHTKKVFIIFSICVVTL